MDQGPNLQFKDQRPTHRGGGRAPRKLVTVRIQTGHDEEIGVVYLNLIIV